MTIVASCKNFGLCVISGVLRLVDEICALLGYYAASGGNFLRTFRDNHLDPFLDS